MSTIQLLLTHFSETHRIAAYLILFLGIFIEGEVLLILAGILSKAGSLNFFNLFFFASAAALLHDLLFWRLGVWFRERGKEKFWHFNLKKVAGIFERFRGRMGLYILISKFIWNFNRVILVAAGYLKVPVKKFIKWSVAAAIIWPLFFLGLGYFFANQTNVLRRDLRTASLFIIALIVIIILIEKFAKEFIRVRFRKIIQTFQEINNNGK